MERAKALFRPLPFGFGILPFDVGKNTFETTGHRHLAPVTVAPLDDDFVIVAVKNRILNFFSEVFPRGVEAEVEVLSKALGQPFEVRVNQFLTARLPRQYNALTDGQIVVVEDEFNVRHRLRAYTVTRHTSPERCVERECPRLDFGQGENVLVWTR